MPDAWRPVFEWQAERWAEDYRQTAEQHRHGVVKDGWRPALAGRAVARVAKQRHLLT